MDVFLILLRRRGRRRRRLRRFDRRLFRRGFSKDQRVAALDVDADDIVNVDGAISRRRRQKQRIQIFLR